MSSFVFYKFKSQREPSRISFDGTGISVWDLKKEIIQENKMGKGGDFDFAIYNADTEEEYTDDRTLIGRSTSVLARRLPPSKPGRGNAQFYMAAPGAVPTNSFERGGGGWKDKASMSKRFDDNRMDSISQDLVPVVLPASVTSGGGGGDEASAMAAMFAATNQQWQATQEQMASATPIHRAPMAKPPGPPRQTLSNSTNFSGGVASGSGAGGGAARERIDYSQIKAGESTKPPPVGYICYRCGQKGHWIQDCPTNNDRAWDDRPRIKRTTGIPKSFLTTVEGPAGAGENGPAGMMVTAEGGFVIAKPDSAAWLAHRLTTKNLTEQDIENLAPSDPDLTCPICSKLLKSAKLTPCCNNSFCEECLENFLVENDLVCPECESRIKNLEKLIVDDGRRERVKDYVKEMVDASKEKVEEVAVVAEETESGKVETASVEAGGAAIKAEDIPIEAVVEVKTESTPGPTATDPASVKSTSPSTAAANDLSIPATATSRTSPIPTGPANPSPLDLQQPQYTPQQIQQRIQMLQQQMYQISITLRNSPMLHPGMRQQMSMQWQQIGMMVVQLQQQMVKANQINLARVNSANNGVGLNGATGGVIPTGPRGMHLEDSLKREREEEEEKKIAKVKIEEL